MFIIGPLFLAEGEKLDTVAGWLGTRLGQGYLATKKIAQPYVGAGLEHAGIGVAKTSRYVANKIGTVGINTGKKIFDKGTEIKNKYQK